MVGFNRWVELVLDECAPSGEGTGPERQRVFRAAVEGWNRDEERIRELTVGEAREELTCP